MTQPQRQPPTSQLDPSISETVKLSLTRDYSSGASAAALPALREGSRFRVRQFHAQGGLGVVHLAEDLELQRSVAFKQIQPARADDPSSRRRFLLEAEITGKLEHPGVVPVYGLVADERGQPAYAMRFIQGETLADAIHAFHAGWNVPAVHDPAQNRVPLAPPVPASDETPTLAPAKPVAPTPPAAAPLAPTREAFAGVKFRQLLSRFVALCNTIAFAHSRGIIHRDIKPANLMLGRYGESLILDWGLARPFDPRTGVDPRDFAADFAVEEPLRPILSSSDQTQVGTAVGTPAYMAPEQADGRWDAVGPAADVYSLGATLYTLLTGEKAFTGKNVGEVLEAVRQGRFTPPRQVNPHIPKPLAAICRKAMSLAPQARYASALELAEDIEHYLADDPVAAYRETLAERTRRWGRKHRALVTATAATVLVASLGLGIATALLTAANARERAARLNATNEANRATRAEKEADANAMTAQAKASETLTAKRLADQAAENRRRDLYVAHMNLIQRAWERSDILHVEELLRRQMPQSGQADLREFEWYYYQGMTRHGHVLRELPGVRALAWSPDSKTLAIGCAEWGAGSVYLWDAVNRTPPVLLTKSKLFAVNALAFNDKGTVLAIGLGTFRGSPEIPAVVPGSIEVWHVPDSFGDLKTPSNKARTLTGHKYPVMGLAFTRDGKLVSVGADIKDGQGGVGQVRIYGWDNNARGEIKLWDIDAAREIPRFPADLPAMSAMALRPDGRLITGGLDRRVTVWEVQKGQEINQLSIPGTPIWALALDDSGHLAVGGGYVHHSALRIWDLNKTAEEPQLLTGHSGGVFCLSYGPGGLLSSGFDRTTRYWGEGDREVTTFRGHNGFILAQALAPNGRSVATGGLDQMVRIWDLEREWQEFTPLGKGSCYVSPDGGHLLISNQRGSTLCDLQGLRKLWTIEGVGTVSDEDRPFTADGKEVLFFGERGGVVVEALTGKQLRVVPPQGPLPAGGVLIRRVEAGSNAQKAGLKRGDVLLRYEGAEVTSLEVVRKQIQASAGLKEVTLSVWRDGKTETRKAAPGELGVDLYSGAAPKLFLGMSPDERILLGDTKDPHHVAISPDGKWLAGGGDFAYRPNWSTIKIWDRRTGKLEAEFHDPRGGGIWGLCFSPDSKRLVSTGLVNLTVWDLASKKPLKTFWRKSGAYLRDPTFSHDGRLVAAGDDAVEKNPLGGLSGSVHLYDMEKLEELPSLRGHGDAVQCVAFSPDGRTLVSGSWDGQIKIWDLGTAEERLTMRNPVGLPTRLQFALGGQILIVRDSANNVITWEALRQPTERAIGQNKLGDALYAKRDLDGAIACYRTAIELDPRYVLAHYNLGNALYDKRALDGAIACYRKVIELDPKNASPHNDLGNALYAKKDFQGAIAAYREAIELDPKHAAAHNNLGNAQRAKKDLEGAVAAYRKSIELNPKDALVHRNLGIALRELGKHGEAEKAYLSAIEIQEQLATQFPNVPEYRQELAKSHNTLGVLLRELGYRNVGLQSSDQGKFREAEQAHLRAIEIQEQLATQFPNVPEYRLELAASRNNLGNLLLGIGKRVQAEKVFLLAIETQEQLATQFPDVPAYRQQLARSHNNLGALLRGLGLRVEAEKAHARAIEIQEQLASKFPNVPEYRTELAKSKLGRLLPTGSREETEEAYLEAIEIQEQLAAQFPKVPEYRLELATSHNDLGLLLYEDRRAKDAIARYGKGIDLLENVLKTDARLVQARQSLCTAHDRRAAALMRLAQVREHS